MCSNTESSTSTPSPGKWAGSSRASSWALLVLAHPLILGHCLGSDLPQKPNFRTRIVKKEPSLKSHRVRDADGEGGDRADLSPFSPGPNPVLCFTERGFARVILRKVSYTKHP